MSTSLHKYSSIRKIFIPVMDGFESENALSLATHLSAEIVLIGLVSVDVGENLSAKASTASDLRSRLDVISQRYKATVYQRVLVAHDPWLDLHQIIRQEEPDLLCISWDGTSNSACAGFHEILIRPMCNLAMVTGPVPSLPKQILVPQRGGPYAEFALKLALSMSEHVHVLHVESNSANGEMPFRGLRKILPQLHGVISRLIWSKDPADQILSESKNSELVIMGASAQPLDKQVTIGQVATTVLSSCTCPVILVRAAAKISCDLMQEFQDENAGTGAISILVDRWFAENTYLADEFEDIEKLIALKKNSGLTVSLALPALNEEETLPHILETVLPMSKGVDPLIDEVVLIDSNSSDRTREIAREFGIPVYIHQELLMDQGARTGKGEALWKSLLVTKGDIILWLDTDVKDLHPRYVYGLLGPLLTNPETLFVKGFYRRHLKQGESLLNEGGGRVTELTARPLLNLFYPELSGIIQPLSGEYAGHRKLLEQVPFFSGYGVETGLLIDIFEKAGLQAIAQVNLIERAHRNQPLQDLGKMSFAIIQVVMNRLGQRMGQSFLDEVNQSMKLIRSSGEEYHLEIAKIIERERPPIQTIPAYLQKEKK